MTRNTTRTDSRSGPVHVPKLISSNAHNPGENEKEFRINTVPMVKWSDQDIQHFVNNVSLLPPAGAKYINEFLAQSHTDGRRFIKLNLDDFKTSTINPRWSRTFIDALEIEKRRRVTVKSKQLMHIVPSKQPFELTSGLDTVAPMEETTSCASPPSPTPQGKMNIKVTSIYATSSKPNRSYSIVRFGIDKKVNIQSSHKVLPVVIIGLDSNDTVCMLRRQIEEKRQKFVRSFQARLFEQKIYFQNEFTLHLKSHNMNFQMDLEESLKDHHASLIQNFSQDMRLLANQMSKEKDKTKVKNILLQLSIDQWNQQMLELRGQLNLHIGLVKKNGRFANNWKRLQVVVNGIGLGAVISLLMFKYTR